MENLREIVLDSLLTLEKEQELSHQLIRGVLDKFDYLESQEKAFIKRVTEGTLERQIELDYYLDAYSSVPVRKMKPLIRNLMRMSVYQLLYMDSVPDSAVCNEACKLAGKRKFQNLKGFVNGVLRKIAREKGQLPLPDPKQNSLLYLSVKYSMPEMIVADWLEEYGQKITEQMLEGLLKIHPVSLRIKTGLMQQEEKEILTQLREAGVRIEKSPYLPQMYLAEGTEGLTGLEAFEKGLITVQDVSSVLAVSMAGIRSGDLVVDACAAPGGKSILAAELTGSQGKVISGDVSEKKTDRIRENIQRMRQDNIEVREWDAREFVPALGEKADVLILDVPCSGLGVMGKKRDIKYRVSREGFQELEQLQKEIVRNAAGYVKKGGILLYSTCTVRRQENREMAQWILDNLPFEPVSVEEELPALIREGVLRERQAGKKCGAELERACAQLLPGVLETDGFFFAKFRRK